MANKKKVSDEDIIQALLTHYSNKEAAEFLHITPQTISYKFKDPMFVSKYNDAKSEVLRNVIARLSSASNTALDLLINSVTNEDIPISLRLQSAKDIIRMNREYIEVDDLAHRIALLENQINS